MEFNRRLENIDANYEFISGNVNHPWYRKKKNIIGIVITVAVILMIVIIAVSVRSVRAPSKKRKVLPPLEWDGVCPVGVDECSSSSQGLPPLLIVSMDGFRSDYMKRGFTPTLEKLSQCGVDAESMYPVFPTKTFPNHYTQVTGLYPSSHGIIDNRMNDSSRSFTLKSPEARKPFWWQKEPIWVSAEKQGKTTATFFWPGSDVSINGTLPTHYKIFNTSKCSSRELCLGAIPFEDRVDQIHKWLDLPEDKRPKLLTLYFHEPDYSAHRYGTDSEEVKEALKRVDKMIERLFAGLQQRNLTGCVNVMIMSDHGMTNVDCSRTISLDKFTDVTNFEYFYGPLGRLKLNENSSMTEKDVLYDLECRNSHMRVFKREQLPVRMHYSSHRRIEPVILEIDSGWTLLKKEPKSNQCTGAQHGYDNLFPDMQATFLAIGPSFETNITVDPFINIELYELMCEMIGINPNPNNGTRGSLYHLLKEPKPLPPAAEPASPAISMVETDDSEYEARVNAADCFCTQTDKQTDVDVGEKRMLHLPMGIPYSTDDNGTLRLLYNNDYVIAFDSKLLMPLWTSFTLTKEMNTTMPSELICWTGDARMAISETVRCADYNTTFYRNQFILQRPLYSPDFSNSSEQEEAAYVTNSIPKSFNHTNIIEGKLTQLLKKWTQENSELNVVMGPAFDFFATGIKPSVEDFKRYHEKYGRLLIPTHIFVVAVWCEKDVDEIKACMSSDLKTYSFLLPNHPFPHNCQPSLAVIEKNSARVVDIENLTGLKFFTALPTYDAIRLRTMMPHRDIS